MLDLDRMGFAIIAVALCLAVDRSEAEETIFAAATVSPTRPADPVSESKAGLVRELRGGVLAHDVDNLWSGKRREGGVDVNAEVVFAREVAHFWRGTARPNVGLTVNTRGDTSKAYGGLIWEIAGDSGAFFNFGINLAIHDGELDTDADDAKSLGSRLLFRVPLEVGYTFADRHRVSLMFDHVSNGYFEKPNEGLDTLGVRYGILY